MTIQELLTDIVTGKYDADFEKIRNAMTTRQQAVDSVFKSVLEVGDRVRFNGKTRPQYLIGAEATLTAKRREKVTVTLDEPVGRFRGGIVTSVSLLELVTQ